jgi:hypothetical protein
VNDFIDFGWSYVGMRMQKMLDISLNCCNWSTQTHSLKIDVICFVINLIENGKP